MKEQKGDIMNKKTALDKMCSDFIIRIRNCEFDCPAKSLCTKDKTKDLFKCQSVLKKYYKQQADIPDGWDVVKEIYKYIDQNHSQKPDIKLFVIDKLNEAGIEVE